MVAFSGILIAVGDMGLDGYRKNVLHQDDIGIQVKKSCKVGRNVVDNFKSALERDGLKKGCIIALSFVCGAVEEAARLKNAGIIEIELITAEDLLDKKGGYGY